MVNLKAKPRKNQWINPANPPFNGIFSAKEASKTGIPRRIFKKMLDDGTFIQVRRGYYLHNRTRISNEELDFAVACKHFGTSAVVGGLTALFHYGLTENVPKHIWVLVPSERRSGPKLFRCIRTNVRPDIGVIDNGYFRITNIERTIVDALKFSTKIGLGTAIKAARTAISEKKTTPSKVAHQAKEMGLLKVVERNWEAITA